VFWGLLARKPIIMELRYYEIINSLKETEISSKFRPKSDGFIA